VFQGSRGGVFDFHRRLKVEGRYLEVHDIATLVIRDGNEALVFAEDKAITVRPDRLIGPREQPGSGAGRSDYHSGKADRFTASCTVDREGPSYEALDNAGPPKIIESRRMPGFKLSINPLIANRDRQRAGELLSNHPFQAHVNHWRLLSQILQANIDPL